MLANIPTQKRSSFNIYRFNTSAWSILPGGRSLGYDSNNVATATSLLTSGVSASGGTNINTALATVLQARNTSNPRCSVIVITDGLDGAVSQAMQTVQKHSAEAAAQSRLLRVFVMGVGDDVSRSMCESLARVGCGATAYISETDLADNDNQQEKAETMIDSILRAPIRVRSIDWGLKPVTTQAVAQGANLSTRRKTKQEQLGAAAKGDNLAPPKAVQQAPETGTLFWAIRSSWYAIIQGTYPQGSVPKKVKIEYEIPGSGSIQMIEVDVASTGPGMMIHRLAARALIQTLEDEAISITDSSKKYWNESEIVRLGKTYSLASTQTSFVATMNGVGTVVDMTRNPPHSPGPSLNNQSDFGFVSTRSSTTIAPSSTESYRGGVDTSLAVQPVGLAVARSVVDGWSPDETASLATQFTSLSVDGGADNAVGNQLLEILTTQDEDGGFDSRIIGRIVFPNTDVPALPAFLSALKDRKLGKSLGRVWFTICVIVFLQSKYAGQKSKWAEAHQDAESFVKNKLQRILGDDSVESERLFAQSLAAAEGHF